AAAEAFSRWEAVPEEVRVALQPQKRPRFNRRVGNRNTTPLRQLPRRALRSVGLPHPSPESNRAASVHHTPEVITGEFFCRAIAAAHGKFLISLSIPARSTSAVEPARFCEREATHGGNRAQNLA